VFIDEPLTIFHNDYTRHRVTRRIDWQYSRQWAMDNRSLFTAKAFGFFLVIFCVNPAAQQGASWLELKSLLQEVWQYGKLTPKLLGLCILYVGVYPRVSKALSARKRVSMLYRVRSFIRLRPSAAKAAHGG
jgi:hypothetical protein